MKVTSLYVSNLLSFDTLDLSLGDGLTVVVGPNGSGKTNVVRVLDLVNKLVDWSDQRSRSASAVPSPQETGLASYVQAMHNDPPLGTPIDVRVSVEWTSHAERERIVGFVRAAVLATLVEESHASQEPMKATLSTWVLGGIDETKLAPLFKGVLAFRHPGYENATWEARYEFEHDGRAYDWLLYSQNSWDNIVPRSAEELQDVAVTTTSLWQALFGQPANTTTPPTLPDPLPQFEFGRLCLPAGQRLTSLVIRVGTGTFSDLHEPFRAAANQLGFPASGASPTSYGLARVLRICVREGLVILGEQFRGLGIGTAVPWRAGIYGWEALARPTPPWDPGFLPLRLFQLKNGATVGDRQAFAAIQREFRRLAPGRSFDVTFTAANILVDTAAPLGPGQVVLASGEAEETHGSNITVVVWRDTADDEPRRERPIQLFGAGTWEALVLAEALASSAGRLTVLDDPASTLHPTWQTVLRGAIRDAPGQVLLVTHSPSLVPMETSDDLRRLVRMSNETKSSRPHRLGESPETTAAARMTRAFALSTDARALLFCRGAVLVSGETEVGALPWWCSKGNVAEDLGTTSALDLPFFSVGSDTAFSTVLSVLHAFGIPWALLCDGKSFDIGTNWNSHIFRQVESAGIKISELAEFITRVGSNGKAKGAMTQELWGEQLELGARHGIFTLATSWTKPDEAIEAFFERVAPGKLAEAEREVGNSKLRKGRWIAQETSCPAEVDKLYQGAIAALVDRGMARPQTP